MSSYFQELNFPWNFQCCPLSRDVLMIVSGVVPWRRGLSMRQRAVHMCEDQVYIFQLALYGILTSSSRGGQYLHCQTLNIDDFQFTVLWNKSEKDQLLPKGRVWVSVQDSKRLKCCDSRQRCLKE
ncbi:hypothetical protein L3X38_009459 [Prunus dulcis]|uniref:Uncharacterized protein n=1 Tax=Prunus dulcis TaxID=3755 RepID=A0AAD4WF85_PRUDU|nr:hypothetical protein L3X38_009459 [Prunus dulcis]